MPLYRDEKLKNDVRLCIWKMTELVTDLPLPPNLDITSIHSNTRRKEILTIYALLHHATGSPLELIKHDHTGRPVLQNAEISISHTKGWAAIVLSRHSIVGVDIEYFSDRVNRVASRFIRTDENMPTLQTRLVNWCAKETVFKVCIGENLQYFDMRLKPFDAQAKGSVHVEDLKQPKTIKVNYELNNDFVLTYAIAEDMDHHTKL